LKAFTQNLEAPSADFSPGLYRAGISYQCIDYNTGIPYSCDPETGGKFDLKMMKSPTTLSSPRVIPEYVVYKMTFFVAWFMGCPEHSFADSYGPIYGMSPGTSYYRSCRCATSSVPGETSYRLMGPSDSGYDPTLAKCIPVVVDIFFTCEMGMTCGGRYRCGAGQLCQDLIELTSGHDPTFNNNPPAVLDVNKKLETPVAEWHYYQHNMSHHCMDLVIRVNVTKGRISLVASNTESVRPNLAERVWSTTSTDGVNAPYDKGNTTQYLELRISHKDEGFKAGLWFIGVKCIDTVMPGMVSGCPMESTWSITHETTSPQKLENVNGTLKGSNVQWWQVCLEDASVGLQIETNVAPEDEARNIRASFFISRSSNGITKQDLSTFDYPPTIPSNTLWDAPRYASLDVLFNQTGPETWGHDITCPVGKPARRTNGTNMLKLCGGSPGFKPGMNYIGVFIDCRYFPCEGMELDYTLNAGTPMESLKSFYDLGLHEELYAYCAPNGNKPGSSSLRGVGKGYCAITIDAFTKVMSLFGAYGAKSLVDAYAVFDQDNNQNVDEFELYQMRSKMLSSNYTLGTNDISLKVRCTIGISADSKPLSGHVTAGQYQHYSVQVPTCNTVTISLTSLSGDADLYVSCTDRVHTSSRLILTQTLFM